MKLCFLNKPEKAIWLPRMFELLYENMEEIASSGLSVEQEREQFLSNVGPALEKMPRQVILATDNDHLVGYVQYYTRGDLLMVEEIQIRRGYRGLLFLQLCRFLMDVLPVEIKTVEAYADPRNERSRRLMQRIGMVELADYGEFVHLRGDATAIRKRFTGILPLETE